VRGAAGRGAIVAAHSAMSAMARNVVPKRSGSVIGVLWR
jgi:hypothetical protein